MLEKALLDIAKKDLEASKYLFDGGFYPHAVFYLQQSVEKALKSFLLKYGMIKKNTLKANMGHNLKRGIVIFFKQTLELGKKRQNVDEKIKRRAEKNVEKLIDSINSSKANVEETIRMINGIENMFDLISTEEPGAKELINFLSPYFPIIYSIAALFGLSLLIPQNCAENTRYPSNDGKQNPLKIYDEKNPLIRSYGDLARIMEKAFLRYEDMSKKFPEQTINCDEGNCL